MTKDPFKRIQTGPNGGQVLKYFEKKTVRKKKNI